MVGGQLSMKNHRARNSEKIHKKARLYYREHRSERLANTRKRHEHIKRIVQQIELNDDPESLFYVENFEEETR